MFNVVLFEPEIPPNTGNIIRLCANTGAKLHLIKPLGFPLEHAKLKRAGLDYHEFANLKLYENWSDFLITTQADLRRVFALTTKGQRSLLDTKFHSNDYFVFGSETKGISDEVRASISRENHLRLAMLANSRSLNLSNSVAVVVYEAWRQHQFQGGA
ncbi:tRNA (uridine(34)/cytosine(34)/5-carboxymethylaminomethyluridine(34)-2'-O)-methyltransferase TrmL [Polynucleobacter sp. HIN5]|uniref:tRNA (uridine(34)/cytosine(34)/5- carboxymethylaminomethyluridine(34)-2'-O)- methyltransferase TrmL n=1 Tax=Polynucleobacter sp. HIN5 TaxID=3047864 RepID=UPI002573CDB4|nr:tRNA (uridine(34)/cytosine(34)/5-carboxymethylaminomethyluridine(34)-2'-O)-methyltransferase TrmL [Polynucleobacter sp. HIN5]